MLAVRAKRLVPPDMTETSATWIQGGVLRATALIAVTERDRPAAIVFWSGRFRQLPAWQRWVEAHYVVGPRKGPGHVVFVRPDLVVSPGGPG